jgi:hypothetical protein
MPYLMFIKRAFSQLYYHVGWFNLVVPDSQTPENLNTRIPEHHTEKNDI